MPEYLSPGVYVEEIDTGDKPIEGVSTSTAGAVGVTARGPVGQPTLVIGVADFQRQFGGRLDYNVFQTDTSHLPLAIEGFFENGGQRCYIVRVLPDLATYASTPIFGVTTGGPSWTGKLLAAARKGSSLVLVDSAAGVNQGSWFVLADPAGAEYVQASSAVVVSLRSPLLHGWLAAGPTPVTGYVPNDPVASRKLAGPNPATPPTQTLTVTDATTGVAAQPLVAGTVLLLGGGTDPNLELVTLSGPGVIGATSTLPLASPLLNAHPSGAPIQVITSSVTTLAQDVTTGARFLVLAIDPGAAAIQVGATGTPNAEIHEAGQIGVLEVNNGFDHNHVPGDPVETHTLTPIPPATRKILQDVNIGDKHVFLDDYAALVAGSVLRLGVGATPAADDELLIVATTPPPGASSVDLVNGVRRRYSKYDATSSPNSVARPYSVSAAGTNPTLLARAANADDLAVVLVDGAPYTVGTVMQIGVAGPAMDYRVVSASTARLLPVSRTVAADHVAAIPAAGRVPFGTVSAIDRGAWGNLLRVSFEELDSLLDTTPVTFPGQGVANLTLTSATGIESGTVLEFYTVAGSVKTTVFAQKVQGRLGTIVNFGAAGLDKAVTNTMRVRTREFSMTVEQLKANPRTGQLEPVASETIRHLSLDPRHSRYWVKAIGPHPVVDDRLTDGESTLVRVSDLFDGSTPQLDAGAIARQSPDASMAFAQQLANGTDRTDLMDDTMYLGTDSDDPNDRRGIPALKTIEEISLIAAPGRSSHDVQNALITQCELLRYRFTVIDPRANEKFEAIQHHRDLYDTKYAAIYYPWLEISDPFPPNPRVPTNYRIPPSGHMLGIYARSDNTRGVHKAPANEVIRGIDDLEVKLQKGQQDILNPRGINVLRDFREHSRGLRVWGARCMTSDPDWKYVNVRRLFIFLEASIDRGTQWVVFEPNDEHLWARVIQSVSAFLTSVWRDGALMGTTPEQAFFVKCDRSTMTQYDIDNGRLIMIIGVAPVKPAEFVIIRIGQWAGGSMSQEG